MKSMKPTPPEKTISLRTAKKVAKVQDKAIKKIGKISKKSDTKVKKLANKGLSEEARGNEYKASVMAARRTLKSQNTAAKISNVRGRANNKSEAIIAKASRKAEKGKKAPMTADKLRERRTTRATIAGLGSAMGGIVKTMFPKRK